MNIVHEAGFFIDVKNLFSAPLSIRSLMHMLMAKSKTLYK